MKESLFIEKNKEKWKAFSEVANQKDQDPELLSKLFVQVSDDLSYARTFYPNRSVAHYLNGIAESIFIQVNKRKKNRWSDFATFWETTLPQINFEARREFLISLLIFAMAFAIGMFSTRSDPGFTNVVLGEEYVAMTMNNIANDDPMGVYKNFMPFVGFLHITLNNLLVAAWTFIFGIFSAIGTVFILLYNGIMVGSFQQFFINQELFKVSFLTIWQHGTIEICSIVLAGGAGLTMGRGVLFPGTYKRSQSFINAAHRGLKIFIGTFPAFILAALIEGFLTRFTGLPDALRISTIILSLALMLGYYVWYPAIVAKRKDLVVPEADKFEPVAKPEIELSGVHSGSRLFENTLLFFGSNYKNLVLLGLSLGLIKTLATYYFFADNITNFLLILNIISEDWPLFLNYSKFPFFFLINTVLFFTLIGGFIFIFLKDAKPDVAPLRSYQKSRIMVISLINSVLINALFYIGFIYAYLILIFLFPLMIVISFTWLYQPLSLYDAIKNGNHYFFVELWKAIGLAFRFGLTKLFLINYGLNLLVSIVTMILLIFSVSPNMSLFLTNVVHVFFFFSGLFLGTGFIILAMGMLYHTAHEISTSENLLKKIDAFGSKEKLFGYERE